MSNSEHLDVGASRWDEMRAGFYSANVRDAASVSIAVASGVK